MNFRVAQDPATGGHMLAFGERARIYVDGWGMVVGHVCPCRADRQYRATALRIARDAASEAGAQVFPRERFGRVASEARRKFISRVAAVAQAMADAE